MAKRRLDTLLVDRGLAPDRERAQALLMAGQVRVDGHAVPKAGTLVEEDAPLALAAQARYVSRGGEKLDHALVAFGLDVRGLATADIGASTGGFTDCLLQRGSSRVYSIDTGKGQLDYRLRNDARVVVMEGVNARGLHQLPEPVDFVVIDVSFISLRLILPAAAGLFEGNRRGERGSVATRTGGSIVALFKPQFEARKEEVPRGGVIRDPQLHSKLIGRFAAWCVGHGFRMLDLTGSPILGADGNREFLFWLRPELASAEYNRPRRDVARTGSRVRPARKRARGMTSGA